jgi:amino acid transporter
MLATFSSLNATVITDPRICFATDETGLFFRSVGRVHPRWGTPYVTIALNASLACAYLFLALAVAAVPVLRWTRPELPRPYRTVAYPVLPVLFVLASVALMLNALCRRPISTAIGFLIFTDRATGLANFRIPRLETLKAVFPGRSSVAPTALEPLYLIGETSPYRLRCQDRLVTADCRQTRN